MRRHAKVATAGSTQRRQAHGSSRIAATSGARAIAAVLAFALLAVLAPASASAVSDACPNATFRTGASANLPDCRAYEQVSPIDKDGVDASGSVQRLQATPNGDGFTWLVEAGIPGAQGASDFPRELSLRGTADWSTQGLLPPVLPGTNGADPLGWTDDMSKVIDTVPSLTNNQDVGLSVLDTATSQFRSLFPGPGAGGRAQYGLAGTSADDRFFVFEDKSQQLTPDAAAGKDNVYRWDDSTQTLSLLGRVPVAPATSCDDVNGPACVTPAGGTFAGPYDWDTVSANLTRGGVSQSYFTPDIVNNDGSKVFFTAAGGQLYVREGGTRTVQVSASQRTTPDPNGQKPAIYMAATPDGRYVFFTSCEKLTDDSTAVSTAANSCRAAVPVQGQDLYRFDTTTGVLEDLTVDSNVGDTLGAAVQGVIGASADGSTAYFAANGVLAAGGSSGNCNGAKLNGTCNVYRWHEGLISFVTTADHGTLETANWPGSAKESTSVVSKAGRVSSDGDVVLLASRNNLTAYNSEGHTELYRYSASTGHFGCVSCDPTGTPPVGNTTLETIVAGLAKPPLPTPFIQVRDMSADGSRVFFESPDRLVADDVNGETGCPKANFGGAALACQDVYEWEAEGSGSCHSSAENGGCLYLISTGNGSEPAYFGDASASGDDVFFFTRQALVPGDNDQIVDVYDARVEGGLASQNQAPAPPCGSAEQCHGAGSAAPAQPGAGSAVFQGPGNPSVHRKRHKRRHRHHRRRRHQHHARKHQKARHAGSNHGGSK